MVRHYDKAIAWFQEMLAFTLAAAIAGIVEDQQILWGRIEWLVAPPPPEGD